MASLPEDVLFYIFEKLDPIELISLSRVSRLWYNVALHPRLHRCVNFHRRWSLSASAICAYIRKFGHSLEKLNLHECYWIKAAPLSCALQKCTKLKSLNVLGCNVSKKTLCSLLQQNGNLTTLEWSINPNELCLPADQADTEAVFFKKAISFCHGLKDIFSGLDSLTLRFPLSIAWQRGCMIYFLNGGVPTICSQLCLNKFCLQWLHVSQMGTHCLEFAIEGRGLRFAQYNLTKDGKLPKCKWGCVLPRATCQELESGSLRTCIMPYYPFLIGTCSNDKFIKRLQIRPGVENLNLGLRLPKLHCLTVISGVQSLKYLNLNEMNSELDGRGLQVIATSSPNLEVLNMQGCRRCLTPIAGLESLALFCPNLTQLNLNGVHYKAGKKCPNGLMENIAKCTNLVSLSLCVCGVSSPFQPAKPAASSDEKNKVGGNLLQNNKRIAHGVKLQSSRFIDVEPVTITDTISEVNMLSTIGTFDHLTKQCNKATEFELEYIMERQFTGGTSYQDLNDRLCGGIGFCYHTVGVTPDILLAIANWTNLQRLTLAMPFMQGCLEGLVVVAQNCPNLQFLSLARLSNLGHSGNVALLQKALSNCRQLKDFRLEQPYFNITESFLLSLGESTHLERVCLIVKDGCIKTEPSAIISLFEKCTKLFFFQALCDITIKASKIFKESVKNRFEKTRPGLVVCVEPLHRNSSYQTGITCQMETALSIPEVHVKEMFLSRSHVAVSVPK